MADDGLLLYGLMDGDLIPGVHLSNLSIQKSRVPASMMNSLLSLSLTKVTLRPTAQLALSLVYTALG